ncbi:MAG: tetratricopeptide repeat protein [Planctomycetes bacterium]|nr:tetratricopeptide repeat protein [Planctomycetota bacterium]
MNASADFSHERLVRVFVSSTFNDMGEERYELLTRVWPELRRLCRENHVEFVEVDMRWGISEEQNNRKETLKLCLEEIDRSRPFFIGLLGERYGWVPEADTFAADLEEEQPWVGSLRDRSVTELEILHGVLNKPEMASRAFFYFRDRAYAQDCGSSFLAKDEAAARKQAALKEHIRSVCAANGIPLREDYADPRALGRLVIADLRAAIEAEFPREEVADPLAREEREHEAFADVRRRTYIGREDYYDALDRHTVGDGEPLVVLGALGGGKSALLANWLARWRERHPTDFVFQHYIGSTPDSADHWQLIARLVTEIRQWTDDPDEILRDREGLLRDFPLWLAKARIKAEHDGVRCVVVIDALNGVQDDARRLGWLPSDCFTGPLRLIVSTLSGETLDALRPRGWASLQVDPLTEGERRQLIGDYLARFSKKLGARHLDRLASARAAANPLYLKTLLDELRVTGTHDRLDERLTGYLAAPDMPGLLREVLARYQRDYDRDRPALTAEALGLIWASRRGLTEAELLHLLRSTDQPMLPVAVWSPLRAALESSLVNRRGTLTLAHDFLRQAVGSMFAADAKKRRALRLRLADYFEAQPVYARACDELPWLLRAAGERDRLRACLLDIDRFRVIHERDREKLMGYWVWLQEEQTMGQAYLGSFDRWSSAQGRLEHDVGLAAHLLGHFLLVAARHGEAEQLIRLALDVSRRSRGSRDPAVATVLDNLAILLRETGRALEAEQCLQEALDIAEHHFGPEHLSVGTVLNNIVELLNNTGRSAEAEPPMRRALAIFEKHLGENDPHVATAHNGLGEVFRRTDRPTEAEDRFRRALEIDNRVLGAEHPRVARDLNNLALLRKAEGRFSEAETYYRQALKVDEATFGPYHLEVATDLNNLAMLLRDAFRLEEAEPLMRRALQILRRFSRAANHPHPSLARTTDRYAAMLRSMGKEREKIRTILRELAL